MSTKNIKKVKSQINDLVNDPNFIRLGELLAEKRELQQKLDMEKCPIPGIDAIGINIKNKK